MLNKSSKILMYHLVLFEIWILWEIRDDQACSDQAAYKSKQWIETEVGSGSIEKLSTVGSNSKEIEQRICIFLAEHYLPLRPADSLIPLLRNLFPRDQALARVTLGNQKAKKNLRKNFPLVTRPVSWVPQSYFFSVIIDKTTDGPVEKQLAIIKLFFSEIDLKIHLEVLHMVKWSDISAEGLTICIKQVIEKKTQFSHKILLDFLRILLKTCLEPIDLLQR